MLTERYCLLIDEQPLTLTEKQNFSVWGKLKPHTIATRNCAGSNLEWHPSSYTDNVSRRNWNVVSHLQNDSGAKACVLVLLQHFCQLVSSGTSRGKDCNSYKSNINGERLDTKCSLALAALPESLFPRPDPFLSLLQSCSWCFSVFSLRHTE